MDEAYPRMSPVERVAALALAFVFVALFFYREPQWHLGCQQFGSHSEHFPCESPQSCMRREVSLLESLRECVLTADRQGIASTERELASVRDTIAQIGDEEFVHLRGELEERAYAMDELARLYARLSPEERAALTPSP